jgi:hypothetical protein
MVVSPVIHSRLMTFWITGTLTHNTLIVLAALLAPVLAGCIGIIAADPDPRRRTAVAAGLLIVATPVFCGPVLASLLVERGHNFVTIRYALALVPLGTAACGYVISRAPRALVLPVLVLAGSLSLWNAATKNVFSAPSRAGQEIRGAAALLRERVRPGDRVVTVPEWDWYSLAYYDVPALVKPRAIIDFGPGAGANPAQGAGAIWTVSFQADIRPQSTRDSREAWRFGTIAVVRTGPAIAR